jgi:hypothetical protein
MKTSWHNPRALVLSGAMSITAVIEQGVIRLPKDAPWATGTVVRIEPVEEQPPTLLETLREFDGMAGDLPADMAANLDHYVHGHARRCALSSLMPSTLSPG